MCHYGAWEDGNEDVVRSTEAVPVLNAVRTGAQIVTLEARLQRIEARVKRLEATVAYLRNAMFVLFALCLLNLAYDLSK